VLSPLFDGVWTKACHHSFFGVHLGSRMTVVKLPGGGLWLHSPVPIDAETKTQLDELGGVEHIVAPNLYHHVYAGDAKALWPNATLHAAQGLDKKRKDLAIDAQLTEEAPQAWGDALRPAYIRGSMLRETVFFHPSSGTLISSDLVENFTTSEHWPTRMYLKCAGLHGKPGWSRFLRMIYRDRKAAATSIHQILEWDFDKLVVAHGELLTDAPKEAIRTGLSWLL